MALGNGEKKKKRRKGLVRGPSRCARFARIRGARTSSSGSPRFHGWCVPRFLPPVICLKGHYQLGSGNLLKHEQDCGNGRGLSWTSSTILALQATEAFIVALFHDAFVSVSTSFQYPDPFTSNLCAIRAKRVTVLQRDLWLARRLLGGPGALT